MIRLFDGNGVVVTEAESGTSTHCTVVASWRNWPRPSSFSPPGMPAYINGHALVVDAGISCSHPFAKHHKVGVNTF